MRTEPRAKASELPARLGDPDAVDPIAHRLDRLLPVGGQAFAPAPGRLGIVVPPALDVMDLEARLLEKRDGVADIVELAAGKDIARQGALLGPAGRICAPTSTRSKVTRRVTSPRRMKVGTTVPGPASSGSRLMCSGIRQRKPP